ncbi:hypothetical protein FUAX_29250 [Fulvitalea axinellae]|uniref:PSP1 C-terminal domain-containing protein n=1 Tax=Fulvitalea axinellae TaxID=1182444 RepID=A0AAU9D3G1_9BACT|nr:hypothetical protein FUAX_29250 [Fulvitalea axinellae]
MSACNSCATGDAKSDGLPNGCRSNGACATGSCNMMEVHDWLSNMDLPADDFFDIYEVRFKGGKKDFFRNKNNLLLHTGDPVVVDVPNGHHVGYVSLSGELVRLQMKKKGIEDEESVRSIYRVATERDLKKFEDVKKREMPTLYRTREIIDDLKLEMKLSDVEFQADNTKATFYYSADDRVDFRELIKVLASEFRIRVEMRQISLRQEASRLGGVGSCGRELCCSTWLSSFKSVSTSAARYQNLSLNPGKLSGQCGRLKCCLNYELETYIEALQDIPKLDMPLKTQKGSARLQKTDIFRKVMWFGYEKENTWHPVPVERVVEIMKQNAAGQLPETLLEDVDTVKEAMAQAITDQLEKMDKKYSDESKGNSRRRRSSRRRSSRPGRGGQEATAKGGNQGNRERSASGEGASQGRRKSGGPKQQGGGERPKSDAKQTKRPVTAKGQQPAGDRSAKGGAKNASGNARNQRGGRPSGGRAGANRRNGNGGGQGPKGQKPESGNKNGNGRPKQNGGNRNGGKPNGNGRRRDNSNNKDKE